MKQVIMGVLLISITYAVIIPSNVVLDRKTKLEWQNEIINKTETKGWQEAINYCNTLNLDEKSDWRLPNIRELNSLVDYETENSLAIVLTLRETTKDRAYWSSTTYSKDSTKVYRVYFSEGGAIYPSSRDTTLNFRCVRDY